METYVLQQVVLWGTGATAGGVGIAGGGQDGHDRALQRRLVHRLHAQPDDRGVDGLRVDSSRPMVSFRGIDEACRAGPSRPSCGTTTWPPPWRRIRSTSGAFPLVVLLRRPDPDAASRRQAVLFPHGLGPTTTTVPPTTSTTSTADHRPSRPTTTATPTPDRPIPPHRRPRRPPRRCTTPTPTSAAARATPTTPSG